MEAQLIVDVGLDVRSEKANVAAPAGIHASSRERGRGAKHLRNRARIAHPLRGLTAQVRATGRTDRIEARPPIVFREPPLGPHPAAILEASKGRVERAF